MACQPTGARGGAIPANMGVVKAQVLIWDHDPFLARANQNVSYPISGAIEGAKEKDMDNKIEYMLESLSLKPEFTPQNMFVATVRPKYNNNGELVLKNGMVDQDFDFVQDTSGAAQYLPNQPLFDKNEFGHRLWIHRGSLFSNVVVAHPSESGHPLESYEYYKQNENSDIAKTGELTNIIESAPRWKYHQEPRDGKTSYWPYCESKQSRLSKYPVHWTLEKYAPVWQGCDFFVIIKKGDKALDFGIDSIGDNEPLKVDDEIYQRMMYKKPQNVKTPAPGWVDGITNAAFYLDRKEFDKTYKDQQTAEKEWGRAARQMYHFEYRPYILIEMGHEHPDHNYIIELAYGRNPRFLHLSNYRDSEERINGTGETPSRDSYKDYPSCRCLGEFRYASVATLLSQDELTVSVKNHMGKLVVRFSGYEKSPWVIEKQPEETEEKKSTDSTVTTYDPKIFMVVPPAPIRIHGGNISAILNFGYCTFAETGTMKFPGQSMDSYEFKAEDLYVTMSTMGATDPKRQVSQELLKKFAPTQETKDRLGKISINYDVDARTVYEHLLNKPDTKGIDLYKIFPEKALSHGKGFGAGTSRNSNSGQNLIVGSGHRIRIYNANGPDRPFVQSPAGETGDGKYVSTWDVGVDLSSGDIAANAFFGDSQPYVFKNVLAPILTNWRIHMTGDHKPTADKNGNPREPIDISPLVTEMSDSWSVDDENSFNHEMQITCYMPVGNPTGYNPGLDTESGTCRDDWDLNELADELYSLHDKAFYVTVKYWWGHPGVGYQRDPNLSNSISGNTDPSCDDTLIQMTGICYGGQFEISANKMYMHLTVKDYMDVLKKQFIVNSPFFDGCSSHVAIYELAKMAGFDDCTQHDDRFRKFFMKHNVDRRPLGFLQAVINSHATGHIPPNNNYSYNGDIIKSSFYGLRISYASLQSPSIRFPNGETIDNCIKFIAKQNGTMVYFDRYGVLKYEETAGLEVVYASDKTIAEWYKPKIKFYTTPFFSTDGGQGDGGGAVSTEADQFEPDKAAHLVYNTIRYSRDVESIFNQIVIATAVPEARTQSGETLSGYYYVGHCFYDQLFDPESPGFLGFRKALFNTNGAYGGIQEVKHALQRYAAWSIPTSRIEFETYGVPCLKPHDIISVDGNMFFIAEISHKIEPNKNLWWMNITGEWYRPYRGDLGLYGEEDKTSKKK